MTTIEVFPTAVTDWGDITGKPATFPPTLPIAQSGVTGLVSDLAGKAPTVHTHAQSDITGLTAALAAKAPLNAPEFTGDTLELSTKDVIHVVSVAGIDRQSVAFGDGLQNSVYGSGLEGRYNLAVGFRCLTASTTGMYNTIGGFEGAERLTTGYRNTGWGEAVMSYITTGHSNTAFGHKALLGRAADAGTWYSNVAVGYNVMLDTRAGANNNVGVGADVMSNSGVSNGLSGSYNNAFGNAALKNIESGINNNAHGYNALGDLTTGGNNIALGHATANGITTGGSNVIIGNGINGLAAGLSQTVIIGDGGGTRRFEADTISIRLKTNAGNDMLVGKANGAGVAVLGTNTNDSAAAGWVGEYMEAIVAVGAEVPLTTGTGANITSIVLTPGDWDVYGHVGWTSAATTSITRLQGSVSLTTAAMDNAIGFSWSMAAHVPGAGSNFFKGPCGSRRVSVNANTTIYLTTLCVFTVSTLGAWGRIWARRVR